MTAGGHEPRLTRDAERLAGRIEGGHNGRQSSPEPVVAGSAVTVVGPVVVFSFKHERLRLWFCRCNSFGVASILLESAPTLTVAEPLQSGGAPVDDG